MAILFCWLIFLGAAEATLRLVLRFKVFYDIEMTRYSVFAKRDSPNPRIGHVHKPNVELHLMGARVKINSDGFRDQEYPLEKGNRYRIIFLGDSVTFGWGIPKEESFEAILERRLHETAPAEIINFGTGNYNTEQEVHLFLDKGLKYDPDQVTVFYAINDAEITPGKSRLWFLGYSQLVTFYWSRIQAFRNHLSPGRGFERYYRQLYEGNPPGWRKAQEAFLRLRDICREKGIALQVILLPELHQLSDYLFQKEYDTVSHFLQSHGIAHLDLAPSFIEVKNPMELWVARDDAHPNRRAHQRIADGSFPFLSGPLREKIASG